jgi:hypothetical protein
VVNREAGAGANRPLLSPLPRRGIVFIRGRKPESGRQKQKKTAKPEKDVKIAGTNSISPLESTKVSKNELKTNWFLSEKEAKRSEKRGQNPPLVRHRTRISCPVPRYCRHPAVGQEPPQPPAGRSGLSALSVHNPSPCGPKPPSGDGSAGEGPSPSADGLAKTPSRDTLPDFWGPMDPIGVQKSDFPRERADSPVWAPDT